jgi:nitrite reductase (cytochrome c-552)
MLQRESTRFVLNCTPGLQEFRPWPWPPVGAEIQARVAQIQGRNFDLLQRAGGALVEILDRIKTAKAAGATDAQLEKARALHRKAQWRLDFVAAENSMGCHAPQEAARLRGESIDYGRQAQLTLEQLRLEATAKPAAAKSGPQ